MARSISPGRKNERKKPATVSLRDGAADDHRRLVEEDISSRAVRFDETERTVGEALRDHYTIPSSCIAWTRKIGQLHEDCLAYRDETQRIK